MSLDFKTNRHYFLVEAKLNSQNNHKFRISELSMREITLFLHSQKIQRPKPALFTAIKGLIRGFKSALTAIKSL